MTDRPPHYAFIADDISYSVSFPPEFVMSRDWELAGNDTPESSFDVSIRDVAEEIAPRSLEEISQDCLWSIRGYWESQPESFELVKDDASPLSVRGFDLASVILAARSREDVSDGMSTQVASTYLDDRKSHFAIFQLTAMTPAPEALHGLRGHLETIATEFSRDRPSDGRARHWFEALRLDLPRSWGTSAIQGTADILPPSNSPASDLAVEYYGWHASASVSPLVDATTAEGRLRSDAKHRAHGGATRGNATMPSPPDGLRLQCMAWEVDRRRARDDGEADDPGYREYRAMLELGADIYVVVTLTVGEHIYDRMDAWWTQLVRCFAE